MLLSEADKAIGRRVKFTTPENQTGYGTIVGVTANRVGVQLDGATKVHAVRPVMLTLVPDDEGR